MGSQTGIFEKFSLFRASPLRGSAANAPNYFAIMKKAIKEMHRQVGDLIINKEGVFSN